MSNKLSYSQIEKWKFCPTAWKFHYIERYRPLEVSSALLFGSAIGKTFEYVLNTSCGEKEALDFFDHHWLHQEINGVLTNTKYYDGVVYSKYDTDKELLLFPELDAAGENPNFLAWYSMRSKGHLILRSFKDNFLPLVTKVYSVEEKTELSNEEGDVMIGFADAVVDIKGYDKPVIIDFKTAARAYDRDSVVKSVQLSGYLHVLEEKYNTRLCGYAVFSKNITKNRTKVCTVCQSDSSGTRNQTCPEKTKQNDKGKWVRCDGDFIETIRPECKMQLIIDEIPIEMEESVVDGMDRVNTEIKLGEYPKNLDGCHNNGFGRACEYLELCHNQNTTKYIKLEKKDELV